MWWGTEIIRCDLVYLGWCWKCNGRNECTENVFFCSTCASRHVGGSLRWHFLNVCGCICEIAVGVQEGKVVSLGGVMFSVVL